ncbi:hypothetical protein BC629DRAFT_792037 [Irpex lacteus]|nr:hypothetical protein BC629DRAFT_792037 [Irpex lacteus]
MSSVAVLQEEVVTTYAAASASVLFLYDSAITLSIEAKVIWRRKWTAMTWLYAFMRYSSIALIPLTFVPSDIGNFDSCKAATYISDVLFLIQYLCFALFSAMRVYALSEGRHIVAGLVFLLNLVPFATNLFNMSIIRVIMDSELCSDVPSESVTAGLNLLLSLFSRISVVIGDVLVLVVTWRKTAQSYSTARRLNIKAPLAAMLLRDGTLYFVILLILNVLQIIGRNVPILNALDIVAPFFDTLPPLIVCRFILDLRQVKPADSSWVSRNQSHSLQFVGNMGQSLYFGTEGPGEEVDELEGHGQHAAGPDTLPEVTTEATDSGKANDGEAGKSDYLDLDVQQVLLNTLLIAARCYQLHAQYGLP